MNKNLIYLIIFVSMLILGLSFFLSRREELKIEPTVSEAVQNNNLSVEAPITAGLYKASLSESVINWVGKRPLIEGYVDNGIVSLKDGQAIVAENGITGSFVIDFNTIKVVNSAKVPEGESRLEQHLKSVDFFDVVKFPEAKFEIIESKKSDDVLISYMYNIKGKLTIKGIMNEISFPAKIYLKDGKARVEADIKMDRTKWGIRFGSGSFFKNLADKIIEDEISLHLSLIAERV